MVDPFSQRKRAVAVVGHRGSRATHPENTIAGFEHAIRCGADAVELDVVVTADGVLAVRHDPVDSLFSALPASVPTLEEVMNLGTGTDVVFDIEAKYCGRLTPPAFEYARMILRDAAKLRGRAIVRSFEHDILRAVHELDPEMPLAALTAHHTSGWVSVCEDAFAQCISPRRDLVTEEEVASAQSSGLAVMPWTVNDPAEWDRLIGMRVDGIITDDPCALIRHLDAREFSRRGRSTSGR